MGTEKPRNCGHLRNDTYICSIKIFIENTDKEDIWVGEFILNFYLNIPS